MSKRSLAAALVATLLCACSSNGDPPADTTTAPQGSSTVPTLGYTPIRDRDVQDITRLFEHPEGGVLLLGARLADDGKWCGRAEIDDKDKALRSGVWGCAPQPPADGPIATVVFVARDGRDRTEYVGAVVPEGATSVVLTTDVGEMQFDTREMPVIAFPRVGTRFRIEFADGTVIDCPATVGLAAVLCG